MTSLVIDFETKDPYIGRKMGAGWVYGIKVPTSDFKVLGASCTFIGEYENAVCYYTNMDNILSDVRKADTLIMHNAQYDFGCLLYVCHKLDLNPSFLYKKDIIDTKVLAHLDDSSRRTYSLEPLSAELFGHHKDLQVLRDAVYSCNLKPWTKTELLAKKRADKKGEVYQRPRPSDDILDRLAMSNMDKLPPEVVGKYCNQDVLLTAQLYHHFIGAVPNDLALKYSNLAKIVCKNRLRGVLVDTDKLAVNMEKMTALLAVKEQEAYRVAGHSFNIHSSEEVTSLLQTRGLVCPQTAKGNLSATSAWLEAQEDDLATLITEARKAHKIYNDFLLGIKERLQYTNGNDIYPEMNILQAQTGRFSSSSPNIQQIPGDRNPEMGKLCREIYIAPEGMNFYSLDYSNQEGRIQLHYAVKLKCPQAKEFAETAKDPKWDQHLTIARMIWGEHITKSDPERGIAKAINLGLSYGMGNAKLARQLDMTEAETVEMLVRYHDAVPYVSDLFNICMNSLKDKGYIKTLGGRLLTLDPPVFYNGKKKDQSYKGLNKITQGSAADQTIEAMIKADQEGIPVLFPVHDELCMIGTDEQAYRLKEIMESVYTLEVPVVVEIGKGKSWGDCK